MNIAADSRILILDKNVWLDSEILKTSGIDSILRTCTSPRKYETVYRLCLAAMQGSKPRAIDLINRLLTEGILQTHPKTANAEEMWVEHNWSDALSFAKHCNSIELNDYGTKQGLEYDDQVMLQSSTLRSSEKLDSSCKNKQERFPLVKVEIETIALSDLFSGAANYERAFTKMGTAELSWILSYSFGQTGWKKFRPNGRFPKKVVPSGGCRHPISQYIYVCDVDGIDEGLYLYLSETHELLKICGARRSLIHKLDCSMMCSSEVLPKVTILYAASPQKSMDRYKESRTYRVLHHDLGHLVQNTTIVSRARQRKVFASYTQGDTEILRIAEFNFLDQFCIATQAIT